MVKRAAPEAPLQGIAQGGGDAPALAVLVDVEPVQIAVDGHVGKADDDAALLGHQGVVGGEGDVPGVQVHRPCGPGVQLFRGVIPAIHSVDRFVKELRQDGTVPVLIAAQEHCALPSMLFGL